MSKILNLLKIIAEKVSLSMVSKSINDWISKKLKKEKAPMLPQAQVPNPQPKYEHKSSVKEIKIGRFSMSISSKSSNFKSF